MIAVNQQQQRRLSPDEIQECLDSGDPFLLQAVYEYLHNPLYNFVPRPDRPDLFDEQTSAYEDWDHDFVVILGGTGAGKTILAAQRTAKYLLETKPYRERCPFWIIGETYKMVCGICWDEKLSKIIPTEMIYDIRWHNEMRNWPSCVILKHPDNPERPGWMIDFLSFAQGRERMQGASIGGYWFNEEVPLEIVEEVQGRCREYGSPGWADFTPLKINSGEWIERYNKPPKGWAFYHLNSLQNDALPDGWMENYLDGIPDDIRETRTFGKFSQLRGQVFKEWNYNIHVIDPFEIPEDWKRFRGIDFGYNNPFCCLWGAQDHDGVWYVYDEHFEGQQLHDHHAEQIKKRYWDKRDPNCRNTYSDHDPQERAELAARGIHCLIASKAINKGIEVIRKKMMIKKNKKTQLYIFKNCKNLIREIPNYKWPEGTDTRNPQDVPVDVDNHAIDAMRYMIVTAENAGSKMTPESFRKPTQRHDQLMPETTKQGIKTNGNQFSENLVSGYRGQSHGQGRRDTATARLRKLLGGG